MDTTAGAGEAARADRVQKYPTAVLAFRVMKFFYPPLHILNMENHTHLIRRCEKMAKQADKLGMPEFAETMNDVVNTLRKQENM